MTEPFLYLADSNAGIDAALHRKGDYISQILQRQGRSPSEIGTIGDSKLDLPLLKIPGLGMIGAPANALEDVRHYVARQPHGFVAAGKVFAGFAEFYQESMRRGIEIIFSDRDGVLCAKGDFSPGQDFQRLTSPMGQEGKPLVVVITGTSVDKNLEFMKEYGLDARLAANPVVQRNPYLLLAENGAIQYNVLTGETRNLSGELHPEAFRLLKREFETRVLERVGETLPFLGLSWTDDYNDQVEKVYIPPKETMVTINVPRFFKDGSDYRISEEAQRFKRIVLDSMVETAECLGLETEELSGE